MPIQKAAEQEGFLFSGQEIKEDDRSEKLESQEKWKVLIVDDEPEIHKVTTMALSGVVISDKALQFLHAYSASEAVDTLKAEADIAVVILDVVMESDDAGLKLIHTIRQELGLTDIRIILRTGQPGYAPEEKVISEYEINDYITKTDATRNKLYTSLCSAIRAYQQLRVMSESRDFLQRLTVMNSALISQKNFASFVRCLVHNSLELFKSSGSCIFLLNDSNVVADRNRYRIEYSTEEMYAFKGRFYEEVLPSAIVVQLRQAILSESSITQDNDLILYIPAKSCSGVLVLFNAYPDFIRPELVQSFVSNIASDLDNSLLLKQISDIAYLDPLTSLPNRTRFIEELDALNVSGQPNNTIALVDIEHFSDINDGLGQDAGNLLLIAVAERLCSQIDSTAVVCRVGADIFGLIGTRKALEEEKVLATFDYPFKVGQHLIPINARIGVCHVPSEPFNGMQLIKRANIALNKAKKDKLGRTRLYTPEMEDETAWRLDLIRKLTDDFFDKKLQVWYQPQLNIQHNKIVGAEALLRWPDSNGGYISPLTFIPIAEYTGLIVDIGNWVVEQACEQVKKMQQQGFDDFRIAVNVSVPQFRYSSFVENIIEIAQRHEVEPKNIELEITESVVMDDTRSVVKALNQLRDAGFTIAIDDFGTGFSSLSYLHNLPIDRVKVDREFIKDIAEGGDAILAETIITLGQRLGLDTIAEGIETAEQLEYIKGLGCDESQGYFHGKPMPAAEFETFVCQFGSQQNAHGEES